MDHIAYTSLKNRFKANFAEFRQKRAAAAAKQSKHKNLKSDSRKAGAKYNEHKSKLDDAKLELRKHSALHQTHALKAQRHREDADRLRKAGNHTAAAEKELKANKSDQKAEEYAGKRANAQKVHDEHHAHTHSALQEKKARNEDLHNLHKDTKKGDKYLEYANYNKEKIQKLGNPRQANEEHKTQHDAGDAEKPAEPVKQHSKHSHAAKHGEHVDGHDKHTEESGKHDQHTKVAEPVVSEGGMAEAHDFHAQHFKDKHERLFKEALAAGENGQTEKAAQLTLDSQEALRQHKNHENQAKQERIREQERKHEALAGGGAVYGAGLGGMDTSGINAPSMPNASQVMDTARSAAGDVAAVKGLAQTTNDDPQPADDDASDSDTSSESGDEDADPQDQSK